MSTFIRSALVAIVMVAGVSSAMAAPQNDSDESRQEQHTPAFPPADFWDRFHL
jgi:hypothetical protein